MNETRVTSFGLYEAGRILIPGFYFTTLLLFFCLAFLPAAVSPVRLDGWEWLAFVFLTVVSGLTMYAKETPKRRRAFQQNQPSAFLQTLARTMPGTEVLSDADAQRTYFYILNNHVPSLFHEKIFFFGTVYQVMIQVRRTTFWFALLGLAAGGALLASGTAIADRPAAALFVLVTVTIYLINVRYNKADRKMQENYQDQIFWLQMNADLVRRILTQERTSRMNPS